VQIDWSFVDHVEWADVVWLSAIAFLVTLVVNNLIIRHWFGASVIAALLFAAAYVFVLYYPSDQFIQSLPKPKSEHVLMEDLGKQYCIGGTLCPNYCQQPGKSCKVQPTYSLSLTDRPGSRASNSVRRTRLG